METLPSAAAGLGRLRWWVSANLKTLTEKVSLDRAQAEAFLSTWSGLHHSCHAGKVEVWEYGRIGVAALEMLTRE